MKHVLCTTLLLCLPLAAQNPPTPAPEQAVIEVGKPAPKFRLNDENGAITSIGGESATWTVLAFYPKASTGG